MAQSHLAAPEDKQHVLGATSELAKGARLHRPVARICMGGGAPQSAPGCWRLSQRLAAGVARPRAANWSCCVVCARSAWAALCARNKYEKSGSTAASEIGEEWGNLYFPPAAQGPPFGCPTWTRTERKSLGKRRPNCATGGAGRATQNAYGDRERAACK